MPCYLFESNKPVNAKQLEDIFLQFDINPVFTYHSPNKGMIETEGNIDEILEEKAFSIHERLGIAIAFLKAPNADDLSRKLLSKALSYYPNAFRYMSDILFKELSFGDYSSIPLLSRKFNNVPKDILATVGTYLREGMDGSKAAKTLYIHRNTFLFRLDKFIKLTNLDVRDYHDALLLELYFQLASH